MKTLVIYDSQYGNTEKIAQAIAKSVSARIMNVADVQLSDLNSIDVLIIGSPTQRGRATLALTQFITDLPVNSLKNVRVAVFDTRSLGKDVNFALRLLIKFIGYAAPKMADIVISKGGKLFIPPEGFIVKGKEGPLAPDELERAKKWIVAKT